MAVCFAQQSSSSSISNGNYRPKLLRAITCNSLMPVMTRRKRLLSEHNECQNSLTKLSNDDNPSNKRIRTETGSLVSDSDDDMQRHVLSCTAYTSFKSTTQCPFRPSDQRRKSLTYINSISCPPVSIISQPSLLTTTTNNMLYYQQPSVIDNNNENEQDEKNLSSIFVTCPQLTAYISAASHHQNESLLIIDCGSPLRHNERRIKESFLLNINDKLSRKRLINRGLKNFLDQTQLIRLNQSETIILYNDSISSSSCSSNVNQCKISPILQCILDEIKRYDPTKTIYILQSSFEEFYQHYPSYCYTSSSIDHCNSNPSPSPSVDLDSFGMSEVLPGLFLGNARDAEDRNLLQENQIKSIINISKTIPCYYEQENIFDYLQLQLNDTCQENLLQYFDQTFEYIQKKLSSNENILVHCQGGISRSPSFIIGYLMKCHEKTFEQAYALVKEKRKIINPNLSFIAQLTRYEQMLTSIMQ